METGIQESREDNSRRQTNTVNPSALLPSGLSLRVEDRMVSLPNHWSTGLPLAQGIEFG